MDASELRGSALPLLLTEIPGPRSRALSERLALAEHPGITWVAPDRSFPVFWERARGANVWDADGNRFVDLTAAFAVAALGHAHPAVVAAVAEQADRLLHGMGDVHPSAVKVELCERLTQLAPGDLGRPILGQNGADAVEAALKAALLHTGHAGVIAFEGGYHGLGGAALEVTSFAKFREPFAAMLTGRATFLPYPDPLRPPSGVAPADVLEHVLDRVAERLADPSLPPVGAVIVEPIQGRGGDVVPPDGFLRGLRALCDGARTVLITDEIYTGFGRTGAMWACDREGVVPDLLCVGKALTGGMPLSACLARPHVVASWPPSPGEAIHTSTFLGHPGACAAALASLRVMVEQRLPERAARVGGVLAERLRARLSGLSAVAEVRGAGLMIGVDLVRDGAPAPDRALFVMVEALRRGVLVLPSGRYGNVVSFSPPLTIDEAQLAHATDIVCACIEEAP
jgi:4-aminobutyrate aminotransferase-like enzyme